MSILFENATAMSINITGAATVSCINERYKFDNSSTNIALPGLGSAGDCVHDMLAKQSGLSISAIKYDKANDAIQVSANYSFLPYVISLTKPAPCCGGRARETAEEERATL